MDSKTTGIVTYLTLVGFIIALAAGTKDEYSAQHINNALVGMLFILPQDGSPFLDGYWIYGYYSFRYVS